MKRIHLLIILLAIGPLCLNAQEKRQTKTITGTSYEDQTVGFKDLSDAQLVISEGDKITYNYYLKDGEEILDGPFTYTSQTKPIKELIEGRGFQRYHYKYPSPVVELKRTVKGSFSNGACDGQWTWTTTVIDECSNYRYWSYVGKMTRCYKDGRPDGQWSMTLDMKAREGTNYKKTSGTLDGTFTLGGYLPDKKIYHYAYTATFRDGKLSMKVDDNEIINGKKKMEYFGGVTFSDEDIKYAIEHDNDNHIYLYRDSLRFEVRCSDYAGEFTRLPIFREDVRVGGYERSDYFGFVDSQYLGSCLFLPALDWGRHEDVSDSCDPYIEVRAVDKIVPLDRQEASKYLNEKNLDYFRRVYVYNTVFSEDDYKWVIAVADSTEKSIRFEQELSRAKDNALDRISRYERRQIKLQTLSKFNQMPDDLSPKCEFLAEFNVEEEYNRARAEIIQSINKSRDIAEIDSLVNCMRPVFERAERYNSRYENYNEKVAPQLEREFPHIIASYIVDKKSKKTVGLTSSYYVHGWEDQAKELLFLTRKFDKLVYTVFWKTLLYVKENIKETDYETAADYYEAYYSKQLALFKYFYDNYSKARKIKTPEELLSAAGISL